MKKYLSILLALILVVSCLAGCGNSNQNEPDSTEPVAPNNDVDYSAITDGEELATYVDSSMTYDQVIAMTAPKMSEEDAEIYAHLTDPSSNPDKVVWRHAETNRSLDEMPAIRADRQFLIELKKALGDKIEIQVFLGGTMGSSADQVIGGLQAGNFESACYPCASTAEYSVAFMPFDAMFLVPDTKTAMAACNGEAGELMRQKFLEDTGLYTLFYTPVGMRQMTSNEPIHNIKDIAGQKIRVQTNNLHVLQMNALGASATTMPFSDLYTNLQQGVVDGQENPITSIMEIDMGEVQDYLIITNHLFGAGAVYVNNEWLQSQSDEVKDAVMKAAKIAGEWSLSDLERVEPSFYKWACRDGKLELINLDEAAYAEFKETAMSCWDKCAESMGVDYFNSVRAAIENLA